MSEENIMEPTENLKGVRNTSENGDSTSSRKKLRAGVDLKSTVTTKLDGLPVNINVSDLPAHSTDAIAGGEHAGKTVTKDTSAWKVKEITDGEVHYFPKFISETCASEWHDTLRKLDAWYHPKLKVYGKEVKQSRSIAAYTTDQNLSVKYSGHTVQLHHEYPPLLQEIQKQVEEFLGEKFNHVMLNLYESGQEYIGKHRDTKENKVITSLSLGAERTFIMTPNKNNPKAFTYKWTLANGSLLVMRGKTQDNWKHEIPKESKVKESRISLTFRQLSSP